MTPSATNSSVAEVLINHVSAETLNTGRMTPSATNSTAAEVLINQVSAETLNSTTISRRWCHSPVFSVSPLTWFIRISAAVLLVAEGVIRPVFSE
jgi:methylglyoxal synthase